MTPQNFIGYVSQKDWEDSDKEVECTVECTVDGKNYKTSFLATDPLEAIKNAQNNFQHFDWKEIPKNQTKKTFR
jgi:hypothetical protein